MKSFIEKIEKADLSEVLEEKIRESTDKNVALMWTALKCFEKTDDQLFKVMGFDRKALQSEVYNFLGKKMEQPSRVLNNNKRTNPTFNPINEDPEAFFTNVLNKGQESSQTAKTKENTSPMHHHNEKQQTITETISKNINWNLGPEKLIKQSLLTGDLESAVDVALKAGRDAEALLIASTGSQELFNKTKLNFFNRNKDLFIKNIFSSIINKSFDSLLEYNVQRDWKEYILYAKTYLNPNEFLTFANNIGDKLASSNEVYTAVVCYILGDNYDQCVRILYDKYLKETDNLDKNSKKLQTQNLFEEVIAINYILNSDGKSDLTDKIITDYCELLINEGLFVEACTYIIKIKNKSQRILGLYDRLYNHCDSKAVKQFHKLNPPYNIMVIKAKLANTAKVKSEKSNTNVKTNTLFPDDPKTNLFSGKGNEETARKDTFGRTTNPNPVPNRNTRPNFPNNPSVPVVNPPVTQVNEQPKRPNRFPSKQAEETVSQPINTSTNTRTNPGPFKTVNPPVMPKQPELTNQPIVNPPTINTSIKTSNVSPPVRAPIITNPPITTGAKDLTRTNPTPITTQKFNPNNNVTTTSEPQNVQMSQDEESVYSGFERIQEQYNLFAKDENKQKDFSNKLSSLFTKLKSHELKINLLKLLLDFINGNKYFNF